MDSSDGSTPTSAMADTADTAARVPPDRPIDEALEPEGARPLDDSDAVVRRLLAIYSRLETTP